MIGKTTKQIKLQPKHRALSWGSKIVPWLSVSGVWLEQNGFKAGDTVDLLETVDPTDGLVGLGKNLTVEKTVPTNVVKTVNRTQSKRESGTLSKGTQLEKSTPGQNVENKPTATGTTHAAYDEDVKGDVLKDVKETLKPK